MHAIVLAVAIAVKPMSNVVGEQTALLACILLVALNLTSVRTVCVHCAHARAAGGRLRK
jgi:hypothetical protein